MEEQFAYIGAIECTADGENQVFMGSTNGKITFVKDVKDAMRFATADAAFVWLIMNTDRIVRNYDAVEFPLYLQSKESSSGPRYKLYDFVDADFNVIKKETA
jgi:hypothetical protein